MPEVQVVALRQRLDSLPVVKKLILRRVERWPGFPAPPKSLQKAFQLSAGDGVWLDKACSLLKEEPSFAARLKMVLISGAFGALDNALSPAQALAKLDEADAKLAIYAASLSEFFHETALNEWRHAFSSSLLLVKVLHDTGLQGGESLPLAVLLHDIGKQLLRLFTSKKYESVTQEAASLRKPLFAAESASLQINHAEAGALLLEKWGFTEDVSIPVLQHHSDATPSDFIVETALLQLVNWTDCTARGIPCVEPSADLMREAGFGEIDIRYWLEDQRQLIIRLEGALPESARFEPQPEEKLENDTSTKVVNIHAAAPAPSEPEPPPQPESEPEADDSAEALAIPDLKLSDKGEATAIIRTMPRQSPLGAQPQLQSNVVAHVNNPSLSAREKNVMKKTYQDVEAASAQQAASDSANDPTPVSNELPPPDAQGASFAAEGPDIVISTQASIDPCKIEPLPAPVFKKQTVKERLFKWMKAQI